MPQLRIIGDVHGKRPQYLKLVNKANEEGLHTLQLGDLGFSYEYRRLLEDGNFNTEINKFFGGNHDDYNFLGQKSTPALNQFNLGDFGLVNLNGVSLFFVRGAFSIDKKYRSVGLDWFPEEELRESDFTDVITAYEAAKPDLVVTHDCPDSIGHKPACDENGQRDHAVYLSEHREPNDVLKRPDVLREFGFNPNTFTTRTQVLLQKLFQIHQPKKWIFGHYHKNWISIEDGTEFQCLNELCYVDI